MGTPLRFLVKQGLDNAGKTLAGVADPVNLDDAANKNFASNAGNLISGTLAAARLPAFSGDLTSSVGSSVLTLANVVAAGTGIKVTYDAKGRITGSTGLVEADIPALGWAKITSGKPTTLAGYGITDGLSSSLLGANNGIATLDSTGKVPASQLPSFVDDVVEFANLAAFPATGESGKIYVDISTNRTYRWSGSVYVEIASSPGTTDSVPEGSINKYYTAARAQADVTSVTGNAGTATKLQTARQISLTGAVTGSGSFDGSANLAIAASLTNTGVAAGTYNSVQVGLDGRVIDGSQSVILANGSTVIGSSATTNSTTPTMVAQFPVASANSATYSVFIKQGSNVQVATIEVVTDGSNVYITQYGSMNSVSELGTFDADVSGGNCRLMFTAASTAVTTIKVTAIIQ